MELNLRKINYVLSIKSEGSVTKAARALHIAQPSLTQSLKKIEKHLGVPLFDRSSGSMRLTYAGERFVAAGLKILQISRDLENEIQDILKNDAGRILLGITLYLGSYMFTRIRFTRGFTPMSNFKFLKEPRPNLNASSYRANSTRPFSPLRGPPFRDSPTNLFLKGRCFS